MKKKVMKNISEDTKRENLEEIDEPLEEDFSVDYNETQKKEEDKDWFNLEKGHSLLIICVMFLLIMFIIESFTGQNETRKNIVEIFKSLILILAGYLFAKNGEK